MKKLILITVIAVMLGGMAFAQGTPVIDITAIIAAIENGFTMYEQLQSMYNQVQTTYRQLEETVKNFEKFDINELDARDPLGSWRSIMTYANRQMNYVNRIENLMNAKNLKVGNSSFSYADFFNAPVKSVGSMASAAVEYTVFDPFVYRSPEEKAAFHSKYGMSPSNYMKYNMIGDSLKRKAAEISATVDAISGKVKEDQGALEEMKQQEEVLKKGIESDSIVGQMQANTMTLAEQSQELKKQTKIMAQLSQSWHEQHVKLETYNEEAQAGREAGYHNYSKGFADLMDDIDLVETFGGRSAK